MGKWLELAARLEGEGDTRDNRDNRDNSSADVPIVPNVPAFPSHLGAGLKHLQTMAAPHVVRAERWPAVVADALQLVRAGWAVQALALGWSPLDLFGAVTDPAGDPEADGLAVRLGGRRVLALCASFATVADDGGGRAYLYRGSNQGARLLWALGDGR